MKRRNAIGAAVVAVLALGAAMYAFAAPGAGAAGTPSITTTAPVLAMNISATGQKQGAFSKAVSVIAVSHEIVSPRDPASGLPTGKRQHKPFWVTTEWGATTPKFLTAMVTNENLTSVLIGLLRNGAKVATIKLTNASVSQFDQTDQNVQLQFTYQKITWTWVDGGVSAQDDWQTSAG
jgi:type VI secretion system secreted protein Hcp